MDCDIVFDFNKYPIFKDGILEPSDDGPCLCLSGKKYKDCCKEKINASRLRKDKTDIKDGLDDLLLCKRSKLPSVRMEAKTIKKKRLGYCMAEGIFDECSINESDKQPDIRFSHTLSRGVVLKNLCGCSATTDKEMVVAIDDHIMINDTKVDYEDRFISIPITQASVTNSFCKKHDDLLFADIEKEDKSRYDGSYIQNLEYALKAVTFELFNAVEEIYYLATLVGENPNVVYDSKTKSRYLRDYKERLNRFKKMKYLSDKIIVDIREFKNGGHINPFFKNIAVELKKYSKVEYSLSEVFGDGYFVNIINAPMPLIIMSYYSDYDNSDEIQDYVCQIQKKQNERTLLPLTRYILGNAKNIYFNQDMINNIRREDLSKLYCVHREGFACLIQGWSQFGELMIRHLYVRKTN